MGVSSLLPWRSFVIILPLKMVRFGTELECGRELDGSASRSSSDRNGTVVHGRTVLLSCPSYISWFHSEHPRTRTNTHERLRPLRLPHCRPTTKDRFSVRFRH